MASNAALENLIALENEQRWTDLLDASRRFVREFPDQSALGLYYQGVAFHELRQYYEAQESYNRSVKLKADDPLVHNALGVLFKDRKKYEEAVREFDKAFELNPGFLNARINKAQTFSLRGMNAEALAIYNEILREDPEVIPVLIFKAECLKELKRPEEAIETYNAALAIEPNAADLHLNKGNIFAVNDRNEQALQSYEKAMQADPRFADAYHNAGLVYQKLGQDEEAVAHFRSAIERDSQNPLPFITLGQLYARKRNAASAEKSFQDGMARFPKSPLCTYSYGLFKIQQNDFETGMGLLSSSVAALNEPDPTKHQLELTLMEVKRESNEIKAKLDDRRVYGGVSFSHAGVVSGLELTTENAGEIPANVNLLKERMDDSLADIEVQKSVRHNFDSLRASNPALHQYAVQFLLMQDNFVRNSEFRFAEARTRAVNLDATEGERLSPSLAGHTRGNVAVELIASSTNSHLTKSEFRSQFNQVLAPSAEGFDCQDALTTMTSAVLKKVTASNDKVREISDFDDNSNTKRFVAKVVQAYPDLAADARSPSVAVALKDFILLNSHLASSPSFSTRSARNYSVEFEKKYLSGAFEDVKESKLAGGITTFQSFTKAQARDMEVTIVMDNKGKATSTSQFVVQAVISRAGKVPPKPDLQGGYFKQVFVSHPKALAENLTFKFTIQGQDINDEGLDKVFLKVSVWKKKSDTLTKLKVEQNVLLNSLTQAPQPLMVLKQQRLLSTQSISISISGEPKK